MLLRWAGRPTPIVPGLRFADLDLRTPGWSARLGLDRAPDAAVSTTALHWLPEPDLRAMYAELASVLRPGGLLLDGDHFTLDDSQTPVLAAARRWRCASARTGGASPAGTRRTGTAGGTPWPPTRCWPRT